MSTLYRIRQQLHTWSRLVLAAWVLAFTLVAVANCHTMPMEPDHEHASLLAQWQHAHDQPHHELCSKVCADAQHGLVKADSHGQPHMSLLLLVISLIWLGGPAITFLLPQAIRAWPRPPARPLRLQFSRFNN
ncbi:hypothetical protein [Aquitalea denitrificans]|uniref:hypothetical protein n=1 Tax=Aquitalea denitrificans TaxID=519081 RepID=UPI0013591A13|nr:hypothetical protein [Aquitalea denitrificans]